MDLKGGCDARNWMDLAEDRDQWQMYLSAVLKTLDSLKLIRILHQNKCCNMNEKARIQTYCNYDVAQFLMFQYMKVCFVLSYI